LAGRAVAGLDVMAGVGEVERPAVVDDPRQERHPRVALVALLIAAGPSLAGDGEGPQDHLDRRPRQLDVEVGRGVAHVDMRRGTGKRVRSEERRVGKECSTWWARKG